VTCGFAGSRPALSRRPRAVGSGTFGSLGRARARAKARGRNLPLQRMFSSCRCSPPLLAAPACSGRRSAGIASRQAVRVRAASPSRYLCRTLGLVRHEPSGRALPPSSPSSPPMRCPGGGSSGPAGSWPGSPCVRLGDRDGPRRLRIRPAVANLPPLPRQPARVPSAETRPSLPVQRHPRGSNRVGEERRANEELSESPGQGPVRRRVMLAGSAPADCAFDALSRASLASARSIRAATASGSMPSVLAMTWSRPMS
jgi:hypothetical protein